MGIIETGYIIKALLAGTVGYLFYSVKKATSKLEDCLDEQEIRQLLKDKMEVLETKQRILEKRLDRVDTKLDLILEKVSNR